MATAMTRAAENLDAGGGVAVVVQEHEPPPLSVVPSVTTPIVSNAAVAPHSVASPRATSPIVASPGVASPATEKSNVATPSPVSARIPVPRAEGEERRTVKRSKLGVPVRVRPSDPEQTEQFDEVLKTQSTSKGGLYLTGACQSYREGMRLFITFPYYANNPSGNSEYWAEVVRLDRLPGKRLGVAVQMLGSMNLV